MGQRFEWLERFWREEGGQDIIEYSLLIVFIAVACAAIVGTGGSSITPIWVKGSAQLSAANLTAS